MKKALYIGGFDMPDGNAAAQRVLSVAKLMRECDYEVCFLGLSRMNTGEGDIDGFHYINLPYPHSVKQWLSYLTGGKEFISTVKYYSPDIVILYNHPAFAIERIAKNCQRHSIKVIADITEWYEPSGNPIFKAIKSYDTERRMRKSHLKIDGLICISNYLADFYKPYGIPVLNLPPLVDIDQPKWHQPCEPEKDKIKIVYAGSPGSSKDRLDLILDSIDKSVADKGRITFDIIGITKEQFQQTWGMHKEYSFAKFHGRLPHTEVIKHLLVADFQIFLRPDTLPNRAGFPTKFVETITSSTLPITNLSSNLADYLQDGVSGFIIQSLSQEDIGTALRNAFAKSADDIRKLKSDLNTGTFDFRKFTIQFKSFIRSI